MTFDALLANLRHASTTWRKVNKNKNLINLVCGLLLHAMRHRALLPNRFKDVSHKLECRTLHYYSVLFLLRVHLFTYRLPDGLEQLMHAALFCS